MTPYPLLFAPILKEKVWGGRRLAELGKYLPPQQLIGESWELADLPEQVRDGRSVIANGELAGRSLRAAIAAHSRAILGAAKLTREGGFPLLAKFLDARENLSVQVHPDRAYVARHPTAHLKSEAWIIVQADPGSVIFNGLHRQVSRQSFTRHLREGSIVEDLQTCEVTPGQCHYLPSGTCHALGAGIVVAEIQTASDTTFRVWDWGRTGRELHLEQALECMSFGEPPPGPARPGVPVVTGPLRSTPLLRTEHFSLERIEATSDARLPIVTSGMPEAWMVLQGRGLIETPGAPATDLPLGTTTLLPAAIAGAQARLHRGTEVIRITLPSPLEGLIA